MNRVGGPRRPQTSFRGRLAITSRPWTLENRAFAVKFLRVSSGMQIYYSIICPIEGIEIRIIAHSKLVQIYLSRNSFVQIRDNDQTGLANFSRRKHEVSCLGTIRTRQVGWQMKFELLTSRFLSEFLWNAQRYFVAQRKIHRRRFNAIFAKSRTRWSRSFCFQLLHIKIAYIYIDENLQLKMIRFLIHYN